MAQLRPHSLDRYHIPCNCCTCLSSNSLQSSLNWQQHQPVMEGCNKIICTLRSECTCKVITPLQWATAGAMEPILVGIVVYSLFKLPSMGL